MADDESGGMHVQRVPVRYGLPRSGGSGGFAAVVLGQWAEAGERIFVVDLYRCGTCGHLEPYDVDGSLPGRQP